MKSLVATVSTKAELLQVTTSEKRTYSLGLTEVGSGDAASLMAACKEKIKDLANAVQVGDIGISRLVTSIVSTMSDQGSTNPVFNSHLLELKQLLLLEVIHNSEILSKENQGKNCHLFSARCIFLSIWHTRCIMLNHF